jgi:transposase
LPRTGCGSPRLSGLRLFLICVACRSKRAFLEGDVPRIICGEHGKITAAVPWARHDDRFSRPFEEFAAWKAAHMPWTRVAAELRITWEAQANITSRVAADAMAGRDRLEGLRRIGIDEKSWGTGSDKFLMIVTDHDTARVVWTGEGRCQATVEAFFDELGPERARLLTHVSAGGAEWIHDVIRAKAPQAKITLDAFHVVKWAGEALDDLRRRVAAELRAAGKDDQAATPGKGMWALRKDYGKLTPGQRGSLAVIAADNKQLYKGVPDQGTAPRGDQIVACLLAARSEG